MSSSLMFSVHWKKKYFLTFNKTVFSVVEKNFSPHFFDSLILKLDKLNLNKQDLWFHFSKSNNLFLCCFALFFMVIFQTNLLPEGTNPSFQTNIWWLCSSCKLLCDASNCSWVWDNMTENKDPQKRKEQFLKDWRSCWTSQEQTWTKAQK